MPTNKIARKPIFILVILLVGIVVSGYWIRIGPPYLIPAYAWFVKDQSSLDQFAQLFESDPSLEKVSLLATEEIEILTSGGHTERIDYADNAGSALATLMDRTGIVEAWRIEEGILFYLGAYGKHEKTYQVAFISQESESPRSSFCSPKILSPVHGRCQIDFPGDWALSYEWVSLEHLLVDFPESDR